MSETITLSKAWGSYEKGATLRVLAPGEEIGKNAVDAQRAAQLVADGYTASATAAKPRTGRK